ncbi:hypothetical protein L1987_76007 [Smallanthus sonchifolius]|uniref:Uncharacterized protein n=1 Tax=Smallanthus sonchifolius TaxID=185202 RepID=A0ACB9A7N3_9ASTR|nr:hypothetical protein L1987_76007 [Smallanthus sonchifolius]
MRRPRRTKASGSEFGFHSGSKTHDSIAFDYEKSGVAILGQHFAEEVVEVPIKKRILLLQSPGQRARSPQPKTPSPHHELRMGREHASEAIKQTEKAVPDLSDFSGIELLAAAACHSSGHVESSAVEEHSTPIVESCPDGIKQDISPMDSVGSSVQDNTFPVTQNRCDNGNDESDKSPVPTKVVRLHWDLNTVMEEWEEPCDILVDSHSEKDYVQDAHNDALQNDTRKSQVTGDKHESLFSGEPDIDGTRVNSEGGYLGTTYNAENCPSKSDVVDSFANPAKCENLSTSIASVSLIEATTKVESDDKQAVSEVVQGGCLSLKGDTDYKLTLEDHLSDCCGSNVSQDKVKSGYDSPAEDGELREPARHTWEKEELEEMECVDYESDDMYEDNSDAIESVTNETVVDHPQTMKAPVSVLNNDIEQGDKADALDSKHSQSVILAEKGSSSEKFLPERKNTLCIDRSTTSSSYIRRSRSERDFGQEKFMGREGPSHHAGQWVDSFSRNSHGSGRYQRPKYVRSGGSSSIDNNEAINYNPRGIYRNESYGIHSGTSSSRDISRDRSRVELRRAPQEGYYNPDPCRSERKVASFASYVNRGANLSRSQKQPRSRSRSGSPPIAWHFQKKRNVDTKRQSPDYKSDTRFPSRKLSETEAGFVSQTTGRMSLQCVSRSFDARNVINEHYRDRRTSSVGTFHRTHQMNDPSGDTGRLNSSDHLRPRFPLSGNYSSIHDDKYGMMSERRRFRYDDDESFKGYSRNKDNGFRYTRIENKCFRDPKNTSEEKGCRYTTNKMFNTGEGHFYKDN